MRINQFLRKCRREQTGTEETNSLHTVFVVINPVKQNVYFTVAELSTSILHEQKDLVSMVRESSLYNLRQK